MSAQECGGDHTGISTQSQRMAPDQPAPVAAQPMRAGNTPATPPGTALSAVRGLSSSV